MHVQITMHGSLHLNLAYKLGAKSQGLPTRYQQHTSDVTWHDIVECMST